MKMPQMNKILSFLCLWAENVTQISHFLGCWYLSVSERFHQKIRQHAITTAGTTLYLLTYRTFPS